VRCPTISHVHPRNSPLEVQVALTFRLSRKRWSGWLSTTSLLKPRRSIFVYLVNLEYHIQNSFLLRQHLVAVFLDLEKAYETTWRCGILRTLHRWNLRGRLPLFLSNFFQDRYFRVRLGSVLYARYSQENGVPQRSMLSVTLFAIAISGMVNAVGPSVATSLYDAAIFYSSRNTVPIERRLQGAINRLSHWALENGFSFSSQNPVCILHTDRSLHPHPSLFLNNSALPFVPSVKFLDLFLDSKLSWEPHLRWLRVLSERSLNVLKVLSGRPWGGDRSVMLQLYRSLVRSKIDYGSFVYGSATKSKLSIIDPVHNTGIRLATGNFRTSHLESLYAESGELPLYLRRNLLLCGYAAK
jgi:hypothetical protein